MAPTRQRAARRPPVAAERQRRSGDRRVVLIALAVIVVSAGFGLALDRGFGIGTDSGPPPLDREGSELIDKDPAARWSFSEAAAAYRIVYDVTTRVDNDVAHATQELVVSRPFESRFTARAGEPPGAQITARRVNVLGAMSVVNSSGESGDFAPPPAIAGSDIRPDVALPDAVERDLIERREQRRVVGRRCQVYRLGGPVNAGDVTPFEGLSEYADVCVDSDGFVLEEVWFSEGDWVRRRVAHTVDASIPPPKIDVPPETVSGGPERGYVKAIDPATLPDGPAHVLAEPPEGFRFSGRYVFSPPDLRAFAEPGSRGKATSIGVTDVYVRGPDVVLVEQTIAAAADAAFPKAPNSTEVDLGPLGTAEAVIDLRANQVRVAFPDARAVRVVATLAVDDVVAIARQLTRVEGTGVRLLDP